MSDTVASNFALSGTSERGYPTRRNYLAGFMAAYRLIKDKEDTPQAFRMVDATCGPRTEKNFARLVASRKGQARLKETWSLDQLLSDNASLAAMEEGSLGRKFLAFCQRENLSADGLNSIVDEAEMDILKADDARRRFFLSGIHIHDVTHVLCDYGRDLIGEACNLMYSAIQLDLHSLRATCWGLAISGKKDQMHLPIFNILRESERLPRESEWLFEQDWKDLLPRPIDEVRNILKIKPPKLYLEHHDELETYDKKRRDHLGV